MHYTASGGTDGHADAEYFRRAGANSSAHFVIGRNGFVEQVVPVTVQAWHAGVSSWKGRSGCNQFSVGIELDNWGFVLRSAQGLFANKLEAKEVTLLKHKNGGEAKWWEIYNAKQVAAAVELAKKIVRVCPTITEIVGHDDIAPGRKTDPGPAWDMPGFRSLVFGRGDANVNTPARVIASSLNLRGGPGTQYEVLATLKMDELVAVVYDVPGAWTQVLYMRNGIPLTGYVSDNFIEKV